MNMSQTQQPSHFCQTMELSNLPFVVLRELIPMLDMTAKRTLRLVSNRSRDLIDTQRNVHFNVTLSDETCSAFLKFNRYDLQYLSRVLHKLQVMTLLSPLKLFSKSLSRCPLPPFIHTLEFTNTHGISEGNFLTLVNFYGKTNSLKKMMLNMMAMEKVESAKAVRQALTMNFVEELELVFPLTMDMDVKFPLLLLDGNFPSLQSLKINLDQSEGYHTILYVSVFSMIARHVTTLTNLEIIQPELYMKPGYLNRLRRSRSNRYSYRYSLPPLFFDIYRLGQVTKVEANKKKMVPYFNFHQNEPEFFENSQLKKINMTFSRNERLWKEANLGFVLINSQKNLETLELSSFRYQNFNGNLIENMPLTHPLDLKKILQNSSETLVTLKLVGCSLPKQNDARDETEDMVAQVLAGFQWNEPPPNFDFNLESLASCKNLKNFTFTLSAREERRIRCLNVNKLPQSLEHLALPAQVLHEDLHSIRDRLTNLKSFRFGLQDPIVSRQQLQILIGDEGIPSLKKVTVSSYYYDWNPITDWLEGKDPWIEKPTRNITISSSYDPGHGNVTVFDRE